MQPAIHVFVSSTSIDLGPERASAKRAVDELRQTKFVGMEHFGSRPEDTRDASLDEVDRSDVYVGIFGGRYGSGITAAEYRRARERELPCFVYFKDEDQIPDTGRDHDEQARARLAELQEELRAAHTVTFFRSPDELRGHLIRDLSRWLLDRYFISRVRRSEGGAVPPEGERALLESIRDPRLLSRARLVRDHSIDFSQTIARLTEGFVGRQAVFEQLAAFRTERPCGYFEIVADAGLGKSALAAEIARREGAVVFFANAGSGLCHPAQCLHHLCAELIARYELPYDMLPPHCGEDASFLGQVLAEAAKASQAPLCLVVDALDEADAPPPGHNPLLLPDRLPEGVHVVVTRRPLERSLTIAPDTALRSVEISCRDEAQRNDIQTYLRRRAQRPEVLALLDATGPKLGPEEFVARLLDASEGNFKYLEYVITDLLEREPGDELLRLQELPQGLTRYYEQFWSWMTAVKAEEGKDEWRNLYRPIVSLLAAAAEPVTPGWLAVHTQLEVEEVQEALLRWRRFLRREARDGEAVWSIVHRSFADFLAEKVDLAKTHRSIAAYYRADRSRALLHEQYGRRHLCAHLRAGGEREALFTQLDDRDWYELQIAADPSAVGYSLDLREGWLLAAEANAAAAHRDDPVPLLGWEIRCALATASLKSLAQNLPPALVISLLSAGLWREEQALAAAASNPNEDSQAEALAGLAPLLSAEFVMTAAWLAERFSGDSAQEHRSQVFASVAPRLAALGLVDEALERARAASAGDDRADALVAVMPHVVRGRTECLRETLAAVLEATGGTEVFERLRRFGSAVVQPAEVGNLLPAIRAVESEYKQGLLIKGLAERLAELGDGRGAMALARDEEDEWSRAAVVRAALPHLQPEMLEEALAEARAMSSSPAGLLLRVDVAVRLPDPRAEELVHEACGLAKGDPEVIGRASLILASARRGALALQVASGIEQPKARVDAIASIAPELSEPDAAAAVEMVLRAGALRQADAALVRLVPRLPLGRLQRVFEERAHLGTEFLEAIALRAAALAGEELARTAARQIQAAPDRMRALAQVAALRRPDHDRVLLGEVRTTIRGFESPYTRMSLLGEIACKLAVCGQPEEAIAWAYEALDQTDNLLVQHHQLTMLIELASHLPAELRRGPLHRAYQVSRHIGDGDTRALVAAKRAAELPAAYLERVFDAARAIRVSYRRAEAIAAIAPHLGAGLVDVGVEAARELKDEHPRAAAVTLAGVLANQPEDRRAAAVQEIFELLDTLRTSHDLAWAAAHVAPLLAEDERGALLEREWRAATALESPTARAQTMAQLAVLLPAARQGEAVTGALEAAQSLDHVADRSLLTMLVILGLSNVGYRDELLAAALAIEDPFYRLQALALLAPLVSDERRGPLAGKALLAALETPNREEALWFLVRLARLFIEAGHTEEALALSKVANVTSLQAGELEQLGPETGERLRLEVLRQALRLALATKHETRVAYLADLAPSLAKLPREPLYPLWRDLLSEAARGDRASLLEQLDALAPVLSRLGGPRASADLIDTLDAVAQWWP